MLCSVASSLHCNARMGSQARSTVHLAADRLDHENPCRPMFVFLLFQVSKGGPHQVVNSFSCSTGMVELRLTILAIMPPAAGGGGGGIQQAGRAGQGGSVGSQGLRAKSTVLCKRLCGCQAWQHGSCCNVKSACCGHLRLLVKTGSKVSPK